VRVLVAKIGGAPMAVARAQELRDAVLAFRRRGKTALAWAETLGESGPATIHYYLASAFDQIWLQPSGDVGITGVSVEAVFLKDALAKVGIRPEIGQRHEYKNAANTFTERGFTDPHREASARLAASVMEQVVRSVAADRSIRLEDVRALVDRAPLSAQEALDAGLVDRLGYRDEVYAAAMNMAGGEARLRFVQRYARPAAAERARETVQRRRPYLALIYGVGAIRLGRSRGSIFGAAMGSDTVAAAFRAAAKDEQVKAIVFRVNSPGGSYVASDAIWRATTLAKTAGKPVVVSMGDVAASGGYYVSMGADRIVALPGTLTGSIGVVGGKLVTADLLARLGIGHDAVAEGAHARAFSPRQPFSDDEWAQVNRWLDRIYDDFTAKVARCRGLAPEAVQQAARGRVWTGADAKEQGLVDELGGLEDAADLARRLADLPPDAPIRVVPRISPIDRIRPPESSEDPAAAASTWSAAWGPSAVIAQLLGLPESGPLTMPDIAIR
jgi:protease-4